MEDKNQGDHGPRRRIGVESGVDQVLELWTKMRETAGFTRGVGRIENVKFVLAVVLWLSFLSCCFCMVFKWLFQEGSYRFVETSDFKETLPIPELVMASRSGGITLEVFHCTIFNGNYAAYRKHRDPSTPIHPVEGGCERIQCRSGGANPVPSTGNVLCAIPDGRKHGDGEDVVGAMGSPVYTWVKIEVWISDQSVDDVDFSVVLPFIVSDGYEWKSYFLTSHGQIGFRQIQEFVMQETTHENFDKDPTGLLYFIDVAPQERTETAVSSVESRITSVKRRKFLDDGGQQQNQKNILDVIFKASHENTIFKNRPEIFVTELILELGGFFTGFLVMIGVALNLLVSLLVCFWDNQWRFFEYVTAKKTEPCAGDVTEPPQLTNKSVEDICSDQKTHSGNVAKPPLILPKGFVADAIPHHEPRDEITV